MNWKKENVFRPKIMVWLGLFLVIPFVLLAIASLYEWGLLGWIDDEIGMEIVGNRHPFLNPIMTWITHLGGVTASVVILMGITGYLYFILKEKALAVWYVLTVALGAGGLNQLFKYLLERERPTEIEQLIQQGGYSFPSGHSMGSLVVYGGLVFLFVQLGKGRVKKLVAAIVAGLIIFLVGISRVYLGVHFPSDVIGGYSLGAAALAFSIALYGLWKAERTNQ
ncbi:phosphatase PAP2 family protein [Lacticigenium naphthae]|uniref:phosphatase PAP2 family protein n=1 Tax=Lacticigenium naphthae TaxID=515351 RepID=UPI0003FD7535|nr:phosphatase PAP2 family protein [Lacticigenium naphthae]